MPVVLPTLSIKPLSGTGLVETLSVPEVEFFAPVGTNRASLDALLPSKEVLSSVESSTRKS